LKKFILFNNGLIKYKSISFGASKFIFNSSYFLFLDKRWSEPLSENYATNHPRGTMPRYIRKKNNELDTTHNKQYHHHAHMQGHLHPKLISRIFVEDIFILIL
jgi:hypothetical protein